MEVFTPALAGKLVLPWKPISIMPIGDIQYAGGGSQDPADMARLAKNIRWGLDNDVWFLGMGDYIDFARPSARRKIKQLDDDVTDVLLDRAATSLEREVLDVLAPTAGRWLGLVEGHHYIVHLDGTTTGQRMAGALQCRYGGDAMMMRLHFRSGAGKVVTTKLFIHHGHGVGTTVGGQLSRYERFSASCMAQFFFIGHHHRIIVYPFDALDISDQDEPGLYHTTRAIILTGSYLRGWMEGHQVSGRPQGLYVERAMMPPVSLGSPVVTLTPRQIALKGGKVSLVDLRGSV